MGFDESPFVPHLHPSSLNKMAFEERPIGTLVLVIVNEPMWFDRPPICSTVMKMVIRLWKVWNMTNHYIAVSMPSYLPENIFQSCQPLHTSVI